MAKKKKRTKSKKSAARPGRYASLTPPSPKLVARLAEADKLTRRRRWADALALLTELDRAYPNRPEVLTTLVNLAYDMDDPRAYQTHAERLAVLEPDNVDLLIGLAGAYKGNAFPWLALTTFQRVLQHFPDYPKAAEIEKTVSDLKTLMNDTVGRSHLPEEIALDVLVLHDRMRLQMHNGDLLMVRKIARDLLALAPTFIPALNNLSQAEFILGETDRGIELAERVLALQPDNFQALSNLTHFQFVTGHPEQANRTADRLLSVTFDDMEDDMDYDMDIWLKKAEALTYLDRNQDVLAVVDAAEAAGFFAQMAANPILYHYRAVAAARTGDIRLARQAWQMVLKMDPTFVLAKENLADLKKPVGEREGAWPLPANSWISQKAMGALRQLASHPAAQTSPKAAAREIQRFIRRNPDILCVLPILLERGDPDTRRLALSLAMEADTPAMRTAVRDFVTGPNGSDAFRAQIAQLAMQEGILSSGMVSMWMQGKQQDLLLVGFAVTEEPIGRLPEAVEEIFFDAMEALGAGKIEQAIPLLKQAAELAPDEPSILNNLALAYGRADRAAESQAIQDRIATEFPDYLFGITGRANRAILAGEFEEARAGLNPLLSRKELHITEFRAIAESFIRLFLAEEQVQGAESWMKMWERIEVDHPTQSRYRQQIALLRVDITPESVKKPGWLLDRLRKSLKD